MKTILANTNNNLTQIYKIIIGILSNQILFITQIFLNHIHEMNKHLNQDNFQLQNKTQHHIIIISNHKIL